MTFILIAQLLIRALPTQLGDDFCKELLAREIARYPDLQILYRRVAEKTIRGRKIQFTPNGVYTDRRVTLSSNRMQLGGDRRKLYEEKPTLHRNPKLNTLQKISSGTVEYKISGTNEQAFLEFRQAFGQNHHPLFRSPDDTSYYFGRAQELQFTIPIRFSFGTLRDYEAKQHVEFATTTEGERILSQAFQRAHFVGELGHFYDIDRSPMNLIETAEFADSRELEQAGLLEDLQGHVERDFGIEVSEEEIDQVLETSDRTLALYAKHGHYWIVKAPKRVPLRGEGTASTMNLIFPRKIEIVSEDVQFFESNQK
jgi:hypothetical protein